jgi:SAM-dependent methyltransferase
MDGVSPDGSPVQVYLALPADPDLQIVRSAMSDRCSVLDLGAGVGRLANPLAADGHRVVAVDNSPEMLAHIHGPTTVVADIWSLDLAERFDVVLALSHLINSVSRNRRFQLLEVCRRHVRNDGRVIIQRHPPGWTPTDGQGELGEVTVRPSDVEQHAEYFTAATTYTVHGRSWTQRWEATIVDDIELTVLAEATGFIVSDHFDVGGAWVALAPIKRQ